MIHVNSTMPKQILDNDSSNSISRMVSHILNSLYDGEYLTCRPTDVEITLMESKVGQGTLVTLSTSFQDPNI